MSEKLCNIHNPSHIGGQAYTYKYVETIITGSSIIIIPTEQKAKGIIACTEDGYVFYATDDMNQAYTNGVINTRTSMSFSDNSVNFGTTYGSTAYLFRCYYWY